MHMPSRTRALRFTAVLTLVVLSLTGFSSGRHHGSRGHGGGGGGCSSSHQDHDASSSTSGGGSYGSDDDGYGRTGGGSYRRTHRPTSTPSGSGGSSTPLKDGTARLVACASAGKPYATVEVANPNGRKATFAVEVLFLPETPPAIDSGRAKVSVPARGTRTVRVPFTRKAHLDLLDHCEVDGTARLAP
ncbi:hypothetical protein [Streptomyces sp. NPDC047841]|uniref:hypothetical protein n=1 Tax=Streptomyces sp. NPDC047841 TaxID=3154708 RepID=UPI0034559BE1